MDKEVLRRNAPRGGLQRGRLEELIQAGGTHRSMAIELDVSVATVRHWLKRYRLKTRRAATRRTVPPSEKGDSLIVMACVRHGQTRFVLRTDGAYRCLRCQAESVARRRRALRAAVLEEAGARCATCGYDRYPGALQFHHLDPAAKDFAISGRGLTRSLQRVREEASKCVLLCANCHAEVEGGFRVLALKSPDG